MAKSFLILLAIVLLETVSSDSGHEEVNRNGHDGELSQLDYDSFQNSSPLQYDDNLSVGVGGHQHEEVGSVAGESGYHYPQYESPLNEFQIGHGGSYYRKQKQGSGSGLLGKGYGAGGSLDAKITQSGLVKGYGNGGLGNLAVKSVLPPYGEGNGVLNDLLAGKSVVPLYGKPNSPIYGEPVAPLYAKPHSSLYGQPKNPIYGEGHGVLDQLVNKPIGSLVNEKLYGAPLNALYGKGHPGLGLNNLAVKPVALIHGNGYGHHDSYVNEKLHGSSLNALYGKGLGGLDHLALKQEALLHGKGLGHGGPLLPLLHGKGLGHGGPLLPLLHGKGLGHGGPLLNEKLHASVYGSPLNALYGKGPGGLDHLALKQEGLLHGHGFGPAGPLVTRFKEDLHLTKAVAFNANPLYGVGHGGLNQLVAKPVGPVYGPGHGNAALGVGPLIGNVLNSLHGADAYRYGSFGPALVANPIGPVHGDGYNPLFAPIDPARVPLSPIKPLLAPLGPVNVPVVIEKPALAPIYEVKYPDAGPTQLRTIVVHDKTKVEQPYNYAGGYSSAGLVHKAPLLPAESYGGEHIVKVPGIPTFAHGLGGYGHSDVSITPSLSYGFSYKLIPESLHLHSPKYKPHYGHHHHGVDKLDKAVAHAALKTAKALIQGADIRGHYH